MAKHTYYYHSDTDDVVNSHDQSYSLPDDYTILPTSLGAKIWSPIVRVIATILSWLYSRLIIHIHIIGKEKVKKKLKIRAILFTVTIPGRLGMFLPH